MHEKKQNLNKLFVSVIFTLEKSYWKVICNHFSQISNTLINTISHYIKVYKIKFLKGTDEP